MERTSSRLLKHERNKVAKQTFLFVSGTVALLLGFIFIILPGFISIVNSYLNSNPFPTEVKNVLQTPLVDAPPLATNNRELTLTGFAPVGSTVVLVLNGQQSTTVKTAEDGRFELSLQLINGSNSIALFAKDESGGESPTSKEFVVVYDQDPPQLIIDSPANETEFDRKTVTISVRGMTDVGSRVTLNGRLMSVDSEGVFSGTTALSDGVNEFVLIATDEAGNTTEQKLNVKRLN